MFCFKQKTSYEMRISDWSSDVCSSDLIYFAALLEDETIGKLIRQRWSHVMVDEYQDTNAIQLEIVYGLAGEQENIFIVGDPSQSIYGFRGSAPSTDRKSTRLNSSH